MFNISTLNPFKKKSPSPYFLTLDVGSDFCKVLIFKRPQEEGEKLKVIGIGQVPQEPQDTQFGVPADIKAVTKNIEAALNEAGLGSEINPREVIIGVSGELAKGITTRARLTRTHPDKAINERELSNIEKKVRDAAFIEASEEMAQLHGQPNLPIEITSSEITGMEIDGFKVTNPLDFKGETVEVSYFTAVSPKHHLQVLVSIARSLGLKPQVAVFGMYALLQALLKDREPSEFNGILIDIGGETTDIAVIFGGGIISTRTLTIGGRDFTRTLGQKKDLNISSAESLKLEFSKGNLPPEEAAQTKETLSEVEEIWASGVREALRGMKEIKTFPEKVFLSGGGANLPGLADEISSPSFGNGLSFKKPPDVKILQISDFDFFEDKTGKLKSNIWVLPLCLAVTYDNLLL